MLTLAQIYSQGYLTSTPFLFLHSPSSITFKEEREEPKLFPWDLSSPGPPEISHSAKELFLTDG